MREWAEIALKKDPKIANRDFMMGVISKARYGEERFAKRVEYRVRKRLPMWGYKVSDILAEAAE